MGQFIWGQNYSSSVWFLKSEKTIDFGAFIYIIWNVIEKLHALRKS